MSETPIYDGLVAELGDPGVPAREYDEQRAEAAEGRHRQAPARDPRGRFTRAGAPGA